jgi:hypothetical protein
MLGLQGPGAVRFDRVGLESGLALGFEAGVQAGDAVDDEPADPETGHAVGNDDEARFLTPGAGQPT